MLLLFRASSLFVVYLTYLVFLYKRKDCLKKEVPSRMNQEIFMSIRVSFKEAYAHLNYIILSLNTH